MKDALTVASIMFGFAGGILGAWSAWGVKVRDNQDVFIADLQKQGRIAGTAGAAAAVSSLLLAIQYFVTP